MDDILPSLPALEEEAGYPSIHSPVHVSPDGVRYLTAPGVVTLSKPQVDLSGLAGFLQGFDPDYLHYLLDPTPLPNGAQICKVAGQLCYMSFGRKRSTNAQAKEYFNHLLSSSHGSVLEHANFSLLLYGISRSCTHELVRHRAGFAFSQVSQRYASGKMLRFVERPEYQSDPDLHEKFLDRIDLNFREYEFMTTRLLDLQHQGYQVLSAEARIDLRKKVQQASRSVLPNETEAPIVVTGNVRTWRHFIEVRGSSAAETELRILALRILQCLRQVEPLLFDDYVVDQLPDGTYFAHTVWRKV